MEVDPNLISDQKIREKLVGLKSEIACHSCNKYFTKNRVCTTCKSYFCLSCSSQSPQKCLTKDCPGLKFSNAEVQFQVMHKCENSEETKLFSLKEMSNHKCPVSLKCGDCDMVFGTEMALKAHKQKSQEEYLQLIEEVKFLKDENIRRKKEINEVLTNQNGSSNVFEDFK